MLNRYKHRKQNLKLGFLDYMYSPLFNHLVSEGDFSSINKIYGTVSKSDREKACIFVLLIGTIYKNKIILDYKKSETRTKLCSTLDISERTYYRYLSTAMELGLAFVEGNNLRLKSLQKFMLEVNMIIGQAEKSVPFFLNTKETAVVTINSRKFKDFLLLCRLLLIQYHEHKNKKKIVRKIKSKRIKRNVGSLLNPNYYFPYYSNKRNWKKDDFIGNKKADSFNELFKFLYVKTRGAEPEDLGRRMVVDHYLQGVKGEERLNINKSLRENLVDDRKDFSYHFHSNKDFSKVLLERDRIIKNSNNEINDEFVDYAFSFKSLFGNIATLNTTISGAEDSNNLKLPKSSGNHRILNRMNLEKINKDVFYMDTDSFSRFSSAEIYTPEQYYKYVCSDFKLEYRIGLYEISNLLGLDKSQASRTLKKCEEAGLLSTSERFVYMTIVNGKNPKKIIQDLKREFSMLTSKDGVTHNKTVDRLVYRNGCIMFQIENDKHYTNGVEMSESIDMKMFFTRDVKHLKNNYQKLKEKLCA